MKGRMRLGAAVAAICQREFFFALVLQRNGGQGWERRDRDTQWRAYLSDETLELMDAATASGVWTPDVDGAGVLDPVSDPSGDDPLRADTAAQACDLAAELARRAEARRADEKARGRSPLAFQRFL